MVKKHGHIKAQKWKTVLQSFDVWAPRSSDWILKIKSSAVCNFGGKTFSFRFRRLLDFIIFKWIWTFCTLTNMYKKEKAFHGKSSKILSAAGCFCGLQSSLLNRKQKGLGCLSKKGKKPLNPIYASLYPAFRFITQHSNPSARSYFWRENYVL